MMKNMIRALLRFIGISMLLVSLSIGLYGCINSVFGAAQDKTYQVDELVKNTAPHQLYQEECGGCHLAYPAKLLPQSSWLEIMGSLDQHFGENAELLPEDTTVIANYLTANAGSPKGKMIRGASPSTIRITELPYFKHEHDEVPLEWVKGNSEVGSFSNCNACHQKAASGYFDEDTVVIPGHGRWED